MAWSLLTACAEEKVAIVPRGNVILMLVAGAALLGSLLASSGLTGQAGSSLLLAFGAVVALNLTRQPRR